MNVAVLIPGRVLGQLVERQVDLHRSAARAVALDVTHHLVGQVIASHQVEVGRLRVGIGNHTLGPNRRAVVELDPNRSSLRVDGDAGDVLTCADLGARLPRGLGDGGADATHSPFHPAPSSEMPVDLTDPMVHEDVRGSGRHRPAPSSDDRLRGHRALDALVFEPFVEEVRRAHREQAHQLVDVATGE